MRYCKHFAGDYSIIYRKVNNSNVEADGQDNCNVIGFLYEGAHELEHDLKSPSGWAYLFYDQGARYGQALGTAYQKVFNSSTRFVADTPTFFP